MWFHKLPMASITNFDQLSNSFVIISLRANAIRGPPLTVRQQEGETLREYVKHFNKAVLEIDEVDDQVIMTTFQAGEQS